MSTKSNVFSQGGGGTNYELEVQTAYFINFLFGADIPGFVNGRIVEFRQQSGSLGYETDDLLLKCIDDTGKHSVLLQIKHNIHFSEKNDLFVEALKDAWLDFKNATLFAPSSDRIFLITSTLVTRAKIHLKELLDWPKVKSSHVDFLNEVSRIDAKKQYYDLFKNILEKEFGRVSDNDLFEFLKCYEVFEYDFGSNSGVSKSNIQTFIQLSLSHDTNVQPKQIWDEVFAFLSRSNSVGGYFTLDSLPAQFTGYFDKRKLNKNKSALSALNRQSVEILSMIEDTIGGYTLDRQFLLDEAMQKLNGNQIAIITGNAGVGKSALAKNILTSAQARSKGYILTFKGDQFHSGNLKDILPIGELTLAEVFANFPLATESYVYIDGLEKVLEGDAVSFKQLLLTMKNIPTVKLMATCRSQSLQLVEFKFFVQIKFGKFEVGPLNDEEEKNLVFKMPFLGRLFANKRLARLIRLPKYLDFAVRAVQQSGEDYSDVDETTFINKMWDAIIENKINENVNGFPMRRRKMFIDIAVRRSKEMQPFVNIDIKDEDALAKLIFDNVVVQSEGNNIYAASHDVLEDWGLVKYVNDEFHKAENTKDLFSSLGTNPAMRRAYRLWVQNALNEMSAEKISFFTNSLKSSQPDQFWHDETLIAVLNSANCPVFLDKNLDNLSRDRWKTFIRLVHILRTACKETAANEENGRYNVPTGHGWEPVLKYFSLNINKIPTEYFDLAINTIDNWSGILVSGAPEPSVIRDAGISILHILDNHVLPNASKSYDKEKVLRCVALLFKLSDGLQLEVGEMLAKARRTARNAEINYSWKYKKYAEEIIRLALDGLQSTQLAKYFPDQIIEIAKEEWYKRPRKRPANSKSIFPFDDELYATGINHYFGLEENSGLDYFPASAYQTPVLWLLRSHQFKGLDFVIGLVNSATQKYFLSEFSKEDGCEEITFTLPDKTEITQRGNAVLWCMFRGTGKATPYLLQSVLMALELYLFELAGAADTEGIGLQKAIEYLFKNSKSVAISSVIASAIQAFPLALGEFIPPFIANEHLFIWDVSRYTRDFNPLAPFTRDRVYQTERLASHKMEHRLKFIPGLKGFIVYYCANYGLANKKIFEKIDHLKATADPLGMGWRKMLDDIDIRMWRPTQEFRTEEKKGFILEPVYSGEVMEYAENQKKEFGESEKRVSFRHLLLSVEKREQHITINKWREICEYYATIEEFNVFEFVPGLLFAIGIRDLWDQMAEEEKKQSVEFICQIVYNFVHSHSQPYQDTLDFSIFDVHAAMATFPSLLQIKDIPGGSGLIEELLVLLVITDTHKNDPDYDIFIKTFETILWIDFTQAFKYYKGLLAYAKFKKQNPINFPMLRSDEAMKEYDEKYSSLVDDILSGDTEWNPQHINLTDYSAHVLQKLIKITPAKNPSEDCVRFIKKMLSVYVEFETKKDHEKHFTHDGQYDDSMLDIRFALEDKIGSIIFWNSPEENGEMLDWLICEFYREEVLTAIFNAHNTDLFGFFKNIFRNLVIIADENLPKDDDLKTQNTIGHFQKLWLHFDEVLTKRKTPLFCDILLLNIEWNEASSSWLPIEKMTAFFQVAVLKYGRFNIQAVFNLLSHVGDATLLPDGIDWLTIILKKTEKRENFTRYKHAGQLLHRVYDNHLRELKANKQTFENFLWLIDEMVAEGSSDAYWIREFLISFR